MSYDFIKSQGGDSQNVFSLYFSDSAQNRLISCAMNLHEKLDGAMLSNPDFPQGVRVSGEMLSLRFLKDVSEGAFSDEKINDDYVNLMHNIIMGFPSESSMYEKHLFFLDISIINASMIYNNLLKIQEKDAAWNINGLVYFWNLFAHQQNTEEALFPKSSSFCKFIGEIFFLTKDGTFAGSDSGFLETFNILARRHERGDKGFESLDAESMLSAVPW